jgi:hypothetical protein
LRRIVTRHDRSLAALAFDGALLDETLNPNRVSDAKREKTQDDSCG